MADENSVATSAAAPEAPLSLVVASSYSPPALLHAGQDDDPLMEEVLWGFDPAHCLQELGTEWTTLQASVALFDKKF